MTTDRRAYLADYWRQTAALRGIRPRQANGPVREHLLRLIATGTSARQIALAARMAESNVRRILANPDGTCLARTADALLAVRPTVTPVGLTRRVRALAALGWSTSQVAERAGVHRNTVEACRRGETHQPKATRALVETYEHLSMRLPPRATRYQRASIGLVLANAQAGNWAPPLAWGDEIDDPAAPPPAGYGRPGECATYGCDQPRAQRGRRCWHHYFTDRFGTEPAPDIDLDGWVWLVRGGVEPGQAAERCGTTAAQAMKAITTAATRAGHTEALALLDQLRRLAA